MNEQLGFEREEKEEEPVFEKRRDFDEQPVTIEDLEGETDLDKLLTLWSWTIEGSAEEELALDRYEIVGYELLQRVITEDDVQRIIDNWMDPVSPTLKLARKKK